MMKTRSSGSQTLLEAIKEDHREIETFYKEYISSSGDPDAQERWANQFIWEVARHSIGEELVVYPLLEETMGAKGKHMADHDRQDHQLVKENIKKLESMKPGSNEFTTILTDTIDHLLEHIKSEEEEDFPQLESALGFDRSVEIAKSFQRTKMFVPTRSHPSAPSKPPFETLAGLLAAPIDKLKDAFSKFPADHEVEVATRIEAKN